MFPFMDLGRIELSRASAEKRLNPADFGWVEPKLPSCRRRLPSADVISLRHLVGNPWATPRAGWWWQNGTANASC